MAMLSRRKLKRIACYLNQNEIVVCALKRDNKFLKRMRYVKNSRDEGPGLWERAIFKRKGLTVCLLF